MTVEEIKQTYSMREIIERCGIKVEKGMCCCPFHKDKHPSMMVTKDSYYCFVCCESGDVFTFIQKYDNCDFKTAFYSLGGTYSNDHNKAKIAQYRAQKLREKRQAQERKQHDLIRKNNMYIHAYRNLYQKQEEGSEDFWYYLDKYHMALLHDANLQERSEGD